MKFIKLNAKIICKFRFGLFCVLLAIAYIQDERRSFFLSFWYRYVCLRAVIRSQYYVGTYTYNVPLYRPTSFTHLGLWTGLNLTLTERKCAGLLVYVQNIIKLQLV